MLIESLLQQLRAARKEAGLATEMQMQVANCQAEIKEYQHANEQLRTQVADM